MFELVDGEKRKHIAFSSNDSININDIKFKERIYFVQSIYPICVKPKYIEFVSVFSDNTPNKIFTDFLNGNKMIYGYKCYDTTQLKRHNKLPYEHSITFVQNKN